MAHILMGGRRRRETSRGGDLRLLLFGRLVLPNVRPEEVGYSDDEKYRTSTFS
jgi:hypothetical protein